MHFTLNYTLCCGLWALHSTFDYAFCFAFHSGIYISLLDLHFILHYEFHSGLCISLWAMHFTLYYPLHCWLCILRKPMHLTLDCISLWTFLFQVHFCLDYAFHSRPCILLRAMRFTLGHCGLIVVLILIKHLYGACQWFRSAPDISQWQIKL